MSSSPRVVCIGGLDPRDLKTALLSGSSLRKDEVLAFVGRIYNLKDLKDTDATNVEGQRFDRDLLRVHCTKGVWLF